MRHPLASARYVVDINNSLRAVETYQGDDEHEAWRLTIGVLSALYRAESVKSKHDSTYWKHRESAIEGQTLGALMWHRGAVEHAGEEVRQSMFITTSVMTRVDGGKWVESDILTRTHGGDWVPSETVVRAWVWVAVPDRSDKSGRDAWYAQHVAGQAWIAPLRVAAHWLIDR